MAWLLALGLLQGLTEFLPVSSSGHLALLQHYIPAGLLSDPLAFDVLLHLATLIAIILYFRHDLIALVVGLFKPQADGASDLGATGARGLLAALIAGTLGTAILFWALGSFAEASFHDIRRVAAGLL